MIPALRTSLQKPKALFFALSLILVASIGFAIYRENIFFLGLPIGVVALFYIILDFKLLYYLLLLSIPFSTELELPGGFSLFVFSEPLVLLLVICGAGVLVQHNFKVSRFYLYHPFSLLLFLFFGWAIFSTLFSVDIIKSIKYLVALACYWSVFIFLPLFIIRKPTDIRNILSFFLIALALVVLVVLGKHLILGLSFEKVNKAVGPFFLNHVVYSVTATLALPLAYYLIKTSNSFKKRIWTFVFLILLTAIIFSYTRLSWLCLPFLGFYYFIIKWRLMKGILIFSFLAIVIGFSYLSYQNRFMVYAPDYEKTIFNKGNLEKHLEATYKFQDVSGMERIYRWVAAIRLAKDKPFTGSGPSTFYPEYQKYTVKSFRTYVSDNPEHSTTHNYFLLQFAEQGYIGGVILLVFMCYLLLWPVRLYHRTSNPEFRLIIISVGASLFVIIFHLLLNELLGLDKIGALFYIGVAVLWKIDYWVREEELGLSK